MKKYIVSILLGLIISTGCLAGDDKPSKKDIYVVSISHTDTNITYITVCFYNALYLTTINPDGSSSTIQMMRDKGMAIKPIECD